MAFSFSSTCRAGEGVSGVAPVAYPGYSSGWGRDWRVQQACTSLDQARETFLSSAQQLRDVLPIHDALHEIELLERDLKIPTADERDFREEFAQLQRARESVLGVGQLQKKLAIVQKWMGAYYDRSILDSDPESVEFVVESGLLHILKMYEHAKSILREDELDLQFRDGKILVKVDGMYIPCEEARSQIRFDPKQNKFLGWVYTHPNGFCRSDNLDWDLLVPCAELTFAARQVLQQKADQFWLHHDEVDKGETKPCVLQVVCTEGSRFFPSSPLYDNAEAMFPRHVHLRLMDEYGHLFSFGTMLNKEDEDYILENLISLRTTDAKISSPDYEESRPFLRSDVVSIPITGARFYTIRETVEAINSSGGIRFCYTKQNCCQFAQEIMKLAGVQVDTKMTGPAFLYRILPGVEAIPLIGRPLHIIVETISKLFALMKEVLVQLVPPLLSHAFTYLYSAVSYVPQKIATIAVNILFYCAKGHEGRESHIIHDPESPVLQRVHLERFSSLIESIGDIFADTTSEMCHARLLVNWMKEQGSHQAFENEEVGLNVVEA